MRTIKFAAIDIGSNAIRLLIMNILEDDYNTYFKKSSLIRVPIRLGEDTFNKQYISPAKEERLIKSLTAFKNLMEVHNIISYRACATSAMREAINGNSIIKRIAKETGIKIDIITGKEEALIIFDNKIADTLDPEKNYLYVDVGGGSTEITLFSKGECKYSSSFDVGTLRIRDNKVPIGEFMRLKESMIDICSSLDNIEIIGSGGNINRLVKIASSRKDKKISYKELKLIFEELEQLSFEERMIKYDMNPDRADVVVPAATIFLSIMEWIKSDIVHVPKIGVTDGIVHQLHKNYQESMPILYS